MRVRKVAKQIKRWLNDVSFDEHEEPIYNYKVGSLGAKQDYIVRMTKRHYFGLAKKYNPNSMMGKFYIHKACSPYIYEEILSFWGCNIYE